MRLSIPSLHRPLGTLLSPQAVPAVSERFRSVEGNTWCSTSGVYSTIGSFPTSCRGSLS